MHYKIYKKISDKEIKKILAIYHISALRYILQHKKLVEVYNLSKYSSITEGEYISEIDENKVDKYPFSKLEVLLQHSLKVLFCL